MKPSTQKKLARKRHLDVHFGGVAAHSDSKAQSMLRNLTMKTLGTLAVAFALLALSAGAFAQTDTNSASEKPIELSPTVVTGSWIPTAENVGPAPLQTITSKEIEQAGRRIY
jgi:hypothetical protein